MKNDLNDVIRRVERLEKMLVGSAGQGQPKKKKGSGNESLPDRIIVLRDSGFFKQPKTIPEVHAKLQSTYGCELDRVVMALLRLSKRKLLRITSKVVGGRKLKAYVW